MSGGLQPQSPHIPGLLPSGSPSASRTPSLPDRRHRPRCARSTGCFFSSAAATPLRQRDCRPASISRITLPHIAYVTLLAMSVGGPRRATSAPTHTDAHNCFFFTFFFFSSSSSSSFTRDRESGTSAACWLVRLQVGVSGAIGQIDLPGGPRGMARIAGERCGTSRCPQLVARTPGPWADAPG